MCLVVLTKRTDCFRRYTRKRANLGVFFHNFLYIKELFEGHTTRSHQLELKFLVPRRTVFFYNQPPEDLFSVYGDICKDDPGLAYEISHMYGYVYWGDPRVFTAQWGLSQGF